MTRPPEGEPGEPGSSDDSDVSETGVGWPGERPRPVAPADPPAPRSQAPQSAPPPMRPSAPPGTWRRVPEPIVPERPGTVTAAAVILFVGAGLGVLGCCGVNFLAGQADLSSAEQNLVLLFGAILLGAALLNVLLGYYILQGRQWARITTIGFCVLGIIGSVVNQFASFGDAEAAGPFSTCLGVILNVLVIGLLSGERASYYFRFANT